MADLNEYTYGNDRTVHRQEDGSWVNEYGEPVADPRDGDVTVAEFGYSDGDAGEFEESKGSTVYGAKGEVSAVEVHYEDADGTDYEVTAGGFSGEAYAGDQEASLGFGVTAASFTAEGGEWSADEAGESRLTAGLSAGPSLGAHATYGTDQDGDGRQEYGLEIDAAFFKIGFVTEEDEAGSISTLDDQAVAWAGETYDSAAQTVTETYDSAAQAVTETYDAAGQYVDEAYDSAAQTVTETYDAAAQTVTETYDAAGQYADETYDSAAQTATETYDAVSEWISGDDAVEEEGEY